MADKKNAAGQHQLANMVASVRHLFSSLSPLPLAESHPPPFFLPSFFPTLQSSRLGPHALRFMPHALHLTPTPHGHGHALYPRPRARPNPTPAPRPVPTPPTPDALYPVPTLSPRLLRSARAHSPLPLSIVMPRSRKRRATAWCATPKPLTRHPASLLQ
ncbi:hypothetical protein K438DRAFT_1965043 [Mycena galopus ATCC 62051]|nr:hypothetical protein K438DRAFT_1965043 [Mycena galopus ATCC 62051]